MGQKSAARSFTEAEWIATFARTLTTDEFIKNNNVVMDKNDPNKKVGCYVDEWGTWYDVESDTNPGFVRQQNTLRDTLVRR